MKRSTTTSPPISPRAHLRRQMVAEGTISVKEAVRLTGFGKDVFYDAIAAGTISYVQHGSRKVIPRVALEEWLADRLVLR